jgi:flagellar protein FlaG
MIIQNAIMTRATAQPDLHGGDAAPKVVVQPSAQPAPKPSPQQENQAAESMIRAVRQSNSNLEFSLDPGTKKLVVRMVDTATGEVIRQIPSEVLLAIAQSIGQYQKGLLVNQEA